MHHYRVFADGSPVREVEANRMECAEGVVVFYGRAGEPLLVIPIARLYRIERID